MKTYAVTIKPLSGFGTPLKGDTLFGHICWQAAYGPDLFGATIVDLLAEYSENPFLVVSTAYPKLGARYALKRPDMPIDSLFDFGSKNKVDVIRQRKQYKAQKWMLIEHNRSINSLKTNALYKSDKELFDMLKASYSDTSQRELRKKGIKTFMSDFSQAHNTINRLTGTTGEGRFAPFAVDQFVYMPDAELAVFVGLRDDIAVERLIKALKEIGETGFGKDASTGLGKFEVLGYAEINLASIGSENSNACYTLAPCVPEKDSFKEIYFSPFIRFGRHGDVLAKSGKPFKNPVIMADEGAVFLVNSSDVLKKPYIGTAVSGISKAEPNAVTQGYALYILVRVEASNE